MIRRWQLRVVGGGFRQWSAVVADEHRRHRVVRRTVARLRRAQLARGMRTWVETTRALRVTAARTLQVVRRTVARMRNAALHHGFNTWRAGTARVGRERRAVRTSCFACGRCYRSCPVLHAADGTPLAPTGADEPAQISTR